MLGLEKGVVRLVPHEKIWEENFEQEKIVLKNALGDLALDIQHVGSTSIPTIMAKPILDVGVGVKDVAALRATIPLLQQAGYDVGDKIEEKGEVLGRRGGDEIRTHLIHVEVLGSTNWDNHIIFRDYLLAHPDVAKEYEQIKLKFQQEFANDRKGYVNAKIEFVQSVIQKAKNEM